MPAEPVTLPAHCAHCGGAITIQLDDEPMDQPQALACPYCQKLNQGEYRHRIAWLTSGHDPAPKA